MNWTAGLNSWLASLFASSFDALQIAWPWALLALPLPLLVYFLVPRSSHGRSVALRFPHYQAMQANLTAHRRRRPVARWLLALLIWLLLVAAAVRPQILGDTIHLPLAGRNLMLATDISGSMETADMVYGANAANRLQAVKHVAGEFIMRREGDRLGLILFGKQAYLQVPLSFDRKTVVSLLNEAEIGLAGLETAIGDAIGLAVKRLRDASDEDRVMILLTDGENTAGSIDPLRAADLAAQENVRIYTIGIGADEVMLRSLFGTRRVPNSQLDEETLTAIAEKTGGRYFRATDLAELEQIYVLLDEYEPVSEDDQSYRPISEVYFWPLGLALLVSVLASLVTLMQNLLSNRSGQPVGRQPASDSSTRVRGHA